MSERSGPTLDEIVEFACARLKQRADYDAGDPADFRRWLERTPDMLRAITAEWHREQDARSIH